MVDFGSLSPEETAEIAHRALERLSLTQIAVVLLSVVISSDDRAELAAQLED